MSEKHHITQGLDIDSLEMSKSSDDKTINSIIEGFVSPIHLDGTAVNVKNSFLGSTQQHAFTSPVDSAYWLGVYETAKYEGRHRFDPFFQWTLSEEKKLIRTVVPLLSPCVIAQHQSIGNFTAFESCGYDGRRLLTHPLAA